MKELGYVALVGGALVLFVGCGGDSGGPGQDAGRDAQTSREDGGNDAGSVSVCQRDQDCDNGLFCDGTERCMPGPGGEAGPDGCVPGVPPCDTATQTCQEEGSQCVSNSCTGDGGDGDIDGDPRHECGGEDCDDTDPRRSSIAQEACAGDGASFDEDCDPDTLYNDDPTVNDGDRDHDGFVANQCCNTRLDGTLNCGTDCDDSSASISPSGTESCNGIDDDCDGQTDEGLLSRYYFDGDGDGFGCDPLVLPTCAMPSMLGCTVPERYVDHAGDCDDSASGGAINPAAVEVCDGTVDNDCDTMIDEGCTCTDGTTQPCGTGLGVCAGATEACMEGAWGTTCSIQPQTEACDHLDNDCDGYLDDEMVAQPTCTATFTSASDFVCRGSCSDAYELGIGSGKAAIYYPGERLDPIPPNVDWGSMVVHGDWTLADYNNGTPGGYVGAIVTRGQYPGPGTTFDPATNLPPMTGTAHAIAVLLNMTNYSAEIWESTSTGIYMRARSTPLPSSCFLSSASGTGPSRTFVVSLTNNAGRMEAWVSATDRCGSVRAYYTAPEWLSEIYGDRSITDVIPRYFVGAIGWQSQHMVGHLAGLYVWRYFGYQQGNCVACPW